MVSKHGGDVMAKYEITGNKKADIVVSRAIGVFVKELKHIGKKYKDTGIGDDTAVDEDIVQSVYNELHRE